MPHRYVIADTHFHHANVIAYCGRPFRDVNHMDEILIRNWNNTVGNQDLVYMLGDFCLSSKFEVNEALCSRLNGRKVLVMGNHDRMQPIKYLQAGFRTATRKPIMVDPGVILMHEPFADPAAYVDPKSIYIFGHVHDKHCPMDDYPNCFCVSVERIGYRPIDLDKLIADIRKGRKNHD